jgi:hypothetical protein
MFYGKGLLQTQSYYLAFVDSCISFLHVFDLQDPVVGSLFVQNCES